MLTVKWPHHQRLDRLRIELHVRHRFGNGEFWRVFNFQHAAVVTYGVDVLLVLAGRQATRSGAWNGA